MESPKKFRNRQLLPSSGFYSFSGTLDKMILSNRLGTVKVKVLRKAHDIQLVELGYPTISKEVAMLKEKPKKPTKKEEEKTYSASELGLSQEDLQELQQQLAPVMDLLTPEYG